MGVFWIILCGIKVNYVEIKIEKGVDKMSNILIVYAHPKTPQSFNQRVLLALVEALERENNNVKIRDLYAEHFQSNLTTDDLITLHAGDVPMDIQEEQNCIVWADTLVFIYPIWWASAPAVMKGYFDRVLAYGFAYVTEAGRTRGLLTDKRAVVKNSTGTPFDVYESQGFYSAMRLLVDKGVFEFCGFNEVRHLFYGGTPTAKPDVVQSYIDDAVANVLDFLPR